MNVLKEHLDKKLLIKAWVSQTEIVSVILKINVDQGGLTKKEIQLNLRNIFSIFMFNELYLFA